MENNNVYTNKDNEVAVNHLFYLGGLLVEGMKNFQSDILENNDRAQEIICLSSFIRMVELREKFESAALMHGRLIFSR